MFQQTNSSLLPMNMVSNYQPINTQDERVGFLGPFLLGGITGGLVAPFFYGNNGGGYNQPYYTNNYYYPPVPGPYYGPYYY